MVNKAPVEGSTMKKGSTEKRRHRGAGILVLGILLMLLGGALLMTVRGHLAYVLPAPATTQQGDELRLLYEGAQEQLAGMADMLEAWGVAARLQGASLSGGNGSTQATLYAVGEGYFDVMHETLLSGRLISSGDVQRAALVVVIDESTSLRFFAGDDPLGRTITLEGQAYEVVGVVKTQRRIGETDEHAAYIPITAASQCAISMQTVELLAKTSDTTTATAILMESTLRTWQAGGSFYHFDKLALGAVMPLRWVILLVGAAFLLSLLARLNAVSWGRMRFYRAQLKVRYARDMLGGMLLSGLVCLLGYAALAGAAYLLADFSIAPLYVFTDWVPEVVVELSSLTSRFWALNNASAQAVRYVNRMVCVQELGRGCFRWGLMAALLGIGMDGIPFFYRRIRVEKQCDEH